MISVLITDYKKPVFTEICVKSVLDTYHDLEVLVHDNSDVNIGLAASSNLLAKSAKGEYLFFLNNDTVVKKDIFTHLLGSPYDITGCREFDYIGKTERPSMMAVDRFSFPAGERGPRFYPNGAIFVKREVFEELGGFDEELDIYGEDRDLCWRAWLAGYKVGYCDEAVFYHDSHCVTPTNYRRRFHSEKNAIRSMLKNYTLKSLLKILPQYLFWTILELGFILLTKPEAIIKSYIPAYWWNIKNLKDTLAQRKKVIRRIEDKDIPFSKETGKFWVLRNIKVAWE